MALSSIQIGVLEQAVLNYQFPLDYYDFKLAPTANPRVAVNVQELESVIAGQLSSGNPGTVEEGLANVIIGETLALDIATIVSIGFSKRSNSSIHTLTFARSTVRGPCPCGASKSLATPLTQAFPLFPKS